MPRRGRDDHDPRRSGARGRGLPSRSAHTTAVFRNAWCSWMLRTFQSLLWIAARAWTIALMPARFQLDPAEFERLRAATEPMAGPIAKDIATERFAAALAPLGVPTIDLLPPLRSAPHGQFFPGTVHLTPVGHETVAAALDAFIRRERLLDPAGS